VTKIGNKTANINAKKRIYHTVDSIMTHRKQQK